MTLHSKLDGRRAEQHLVECSGKGVRVAGLSSSLPLVSLFGGGALFVVRASLVHGVDVERGSDRT